MKKHYQVRVMLPVIVPVTLDWDDDDPDFHHEARACGIGAIRELLNGNDTPELLHDAYDTLQHDGLGYPLDFTELLESRVVDEDTEIFDSYLADICPKCTAGMVGKDCNYCGYENQSWPAKPERE